MHKVKLLIILTSVSMLTRGYGQEVIIKYTITKDSTFRGKKDKSIGNYFFKIYNNNWDQIDPASLQNTETSRSFFIQKPTVEVDIIRYNFKRRGTYYIRDILGHEILLDPSLIKDTIRLQVSQNHFYKDGFNGGKLLMLNDSISSSGVFNIVYPLKYKYIGFLDTLTSLHGAIHFVEGGYSFKELKQNLPQYLKEINRIYAEQMRFFRNFVRQYGMPKELQLYARKEIQYNYYDGLLTPLIEWNGQLYSQYPAALQDTINSFENELNDSKLFESTSFHRTILTKYIAFINRDTSQGPMHPDHNFLNRILAFTEKELNGETKAYEMGWLIKTYGDQGDTTALNTIYQNYRPDPASPSINKLMDSVYRLAKHPGFSAQGMLNLIFEDNRHVNSTLGSLVKKKVILIDCWATWCVPCREQMPFLDTIVERYKDQVQFVALSADQDVRRWDRWIKENGSRNNEILQLYAKGGFSNTFFRQLMINTIPRYILLSASGEILNASMSPPSERERFVGELKKYLN